MIAAENEYVRVLLPAGESAQPIEAPEAAANGVVAVDLDDGSVRYTADPVAEERPGGQREVYVELRTAPEVEPHELSAIAVDPDRYKVVLENDKVRVVRLGFEAGERGLMVNHPPRVIVTLTDVRVRMLFEDGRTDEAQVAAGLAAWLDAQTLQTENAGDAPLEVVLVEPKPSNEEER